MRQTILSILMLMTVLMCTAKTRTTNHLWLDICTEPMFRMENVELSDTATAQTCVKCTLGNWVDANEEEMHEMCLFFTPVDKKVKSIAFLGGLRHGLYQVWGNDT